MPERVVQLADEVSALSADKLRGIERLSRSTKVLALNALIESARAGEHGRGFAVVAREVGGVADQARRLSEELSSQLAPRVGELAELGQRLVGEVRGQRLADLALNAVELVDRNLYERSCDVRWWATDAALTALCAAPDGALAAHAQRRLATVLASYTVYLDLWVTDRDGVVLAHGRPDRFPGVVGADVAGTTWFRQAMATSSGAGYAVGDVDRSPTLGAAVATYATAVRRGGDEDGEPLGALGVFFDWEPQSQAIVEGLRLSPDDRARTRALLLDADGRVLAASDRRGLLHERVALHTDGQESGWYVDGDGSTVGFARTPGYETYRGLGWYGALVQQRR